MAFRVLLFGFLEPRKNFRAVIEAMGSREGLELTISGEPRNGDQLIVDGIRAMTAHHPNVHFFPEYRQKSEAFSECDVVIIPYDYSFGFSGVIADAIHFGKPFLCSYLPNFKEVFDHYPYWMDLPLTPESVLAGLRRLEGRLDHARQCMKVLSQQTSWSEASHKTTSLYQDLVGAGRLARDPAFAPARQLFRR